MRLTSSLIIKHNTGFLSTLPELPKKYMTLKEQNYLADKWAREINNVDNKTFLKAVRTFGSLSEDIRDMLLKSSEASFYQRIDVFEPREMAKLANAFSNNSKPNAHTLKVFLEYFEKHIAFFNHTELCYIINCASKYPFQVPDKTLRPILSRIMTESDSIPSKFLPSVANALINLLSTQSSNTAKDNKLLVDSTATILHLCAHSAATDNSLNPDALAALFHALNKLPSISGVSEQQLVTAETVRVLLNRAAKCHHLMELDSCTAALETAAVYKGYLASFTDREFLNNSEERLEGNSSQIVPSEVASPECLTSNLLKITSRIGVLAFRAHNSGDCAATLFCIARLCNSQLYSNVSKNGDDNSINDDIDQLHTCLLNSEDPIVQGAILALSRRIVDFSNTPSFQPIDAAMALQVLGSCSFMNRTDSDVLKEDIQLLADCLSSQSVSTWSIRTDAPTVLGCLKTLENIGLRHEKIYEEFVKHFFIPRMETMKVDVSNLAIFCRVAAKLDLTYELDEKASIRSLSPMFATSLQRVKENIHELSPEDCFSVLTAISYSLTLPFVEITAHLNRKRHIGEPRSGALERLIFTEIILKELGRKIPITGGIAALLEERDTYKNLPELFESLEGHGTLGDANQNIDFQKELELALRSIWLLLYKEIIEISPNSIKSNHIRALYRVAMSANACLIDDVVYEQDILDTFNEVNNTLYDFANLKMNSILVGPFTSGLLCDATES